MPIANANQNPFTFTKSTTVGQGFGYHSRVIFTYVAFNNNFNLMSSADWYDSIDGYTGLDLLLNNYPDACHGSYIIPKNYWKQGRCFRMKGSMLALKGTGAQRFNLRFGIYGMESAAYTILGIQNNGGNVSYADATTYLAPVDFEFNICLSKDSPLYYGDGYYQFNKGNYNSAGNNDSNSYAPVWLGTATSIGGDNTTTTAIKLWIDGYGSELEKLFITTLTIEEIA